MANYLIRRIFQMTIVVFLSSLAIYLLLNVAPGGPLSGMKLGGDQKTRVTDAMIARLESYLGLDKPLALRYIVWLVGDDWLGADWVYVGLKPYTQQKISRDGTPMTMRDRDTGEDHPVFESFRFWADPGVAIIEPRFTASHIQVKPPATEKKPEDAVLAAIVERVISPELMVEDKNGKKSVVTTTEDTAFTFPEGEGRTRPGEGTWLNISWLTGPFGFLGDYAGFNGQTSGILRLDFGFSWKLSPGQSVSEIIQSRLGNTILLMTTASVLSLVIAIPIGI
jgi:ABC-type microcin C transport system permease subunit YejB